MFRIVAGCGRLLLNLFSQVGLMFQGFDGSTSGLKGSERLCGFCLLPTLPISHSIIPQPAVVMNEMLIVSKHRG